ncbi:MATE family efflux transporter [Streptococcus pluranimalium]|uniref:Probable multidrug resistance protein NorM n=1 Tax=Streptococcus pluranimalium TaxID=82348 RepID=A0A2L0D1N5_9STRE|nr:MATE family efflux transporter [Streptococcus pluranimalium]AUW95722.1 MATE family efflux transporter [Streptococcus pluranimalium]
MKESKPLLRIALPAMAEQFLQMLMGFVDNYLVAQIGLTAVSGVSIANNILAIYQALFIALGAGVSSILSRDLVVKKEEQVNQSMADALWLTSIISLLLGLVSIVGNVWLLKVLGTSTIVAQEGGLYLAIVGGGTISLGLLTSMGAIVRVQGYVKLPMGISILTNFLNALFSALSIYIFDFGITGVALSTVLSRSVGTLILMQKLPIKAILQKLRWKVDKQLLEIVLPAAGERLMMRAGDVVIIAIIVTFGSKVVAGNAVGEIVTQFNYLPAMAISVATIIQVASNVKENPRQVRETIKNSFWLSTLMMYGLAGIIFLLKAPLLGLFLQNSQALQAGGTVALYSLIGVPATAGTLIMTATWQGLGNAKLPFYATGLGMWCIRIGLGYLLAISLNLGLRGVWLATVLDNLFRWLFLTYLYKKEDELHPKC